MTKVIAASGLTAISLAHVLSAAYARQAATQTAAITPYKYLENVRLSGKPGQVVTLSATTNDPDNDHVSVTWWRFENDHTYAGAVPLDRADGPTTGFRIPDDAKTGDTIHIIAEANDDGKLPLTRYARCIVTVR